MKHCYHNIFSPIILIHNSFNSNSKTICACFYFTDNWLCY